MRKVLALTTFLAIPVLLIVAADTQEEATVYLDRDTIAAAVANREIKMFIDRPDFMVRVATRDGAVPPELHEKHTHVLMVLDGEATFISGGKLVGVRKNEKGQIVGGSDLLGGQEYHLKKGDVIMVKAGTPHWWKEVPTKTLTFYDVSPKVK